MNESPTRIYLAADGTLYCEGNWTLNSLAAFEQQIVIPQMMTRMTADGGAGERNVNQVVTQRLKELALGLRESAVTGRDGETEPKHL